MLSVRVVIVNVVFFFLLLFSIVKPIYGASTCSGRRQIFYQYEFSDRLFFLLVFRHIIPHNTDAIVSTSVYYDKQFTDSQYYFFHDFYSLVVADRNVCVRACVCENTVSVVILMSLIISLSCIIRV